MPNYYDIHCHVFNKNVLIRKLVNIVQTLLILQDLIDEKVKGEEMKCKIEGILSTLQEVTKPTSKEVFQFLNKKYNGDLIISPLMFDLAYVDDNDGTPYKNKRFKRKITRYFAFLNILIVIIKRSLKKNYPEFEWDKLITSLHKNIKELIHKIKTGTTGDLEIFDDANYKNQIDELEAMVDQFSNIKPFFGIDPRRETEGRIATLKIIKDTVLSANAKFSGVKLYSPAGFSPTDPVLFGDNKQEGLFKLCEKQNIPITVHNSNSGFACFSTYLNVKGAIYWNGSIINVDKAIKFKNEFFGLNVDGLRPNLTTGDAIAERAIVLNHPILWKLVLEKFPKLTINFAHFGGSSQIMQFVNFSFPFKYLTKYKFQNILNKVTLAEKDIVKTFFEEKGNKMFLIEKERDDRAILWNIFYRIGVFDNWSKAIFDLISDAKYPNAYTDLSSFSSTDYVPAENYFTIKNALTYFKTNFYDNLNTYKKSKFMYGSDFFLVQFFGPTMDNYYKDFKEVFEGEFNTIASTNPERFLNGIKKFNQNNLLN